MGWDDIIENAAEDAFQNIAENNVLPIGVIANLSRIGDDPVGSLTNLAGLAVPGVNIVSAVAKMTGAANVSGGGSTPVIDAALAILKQMNDHCGKGNPDGGSAFGNGANAFQQISGMFQTTTPPDSWHGAASSAYEGANQQQDNRAKAVATADADVQKLLGTEASQVADTREAIHYATTFLNGCIPVALALAALPEFGNTISYGFQIQSVEAAMPIPTASFQGLSQLASRTAAGIGKDAEAYGSVALKGSTAPHARDSALGVDTHDLRHLATQQHQIAGSIESAGSLTNDEPKNVSESHGTVCAATGTALTKAVQARKAAAESMKNTSDKLSESLDAAAARYDFVDEAGRQKMNHQVPPAEHEHPR
jgi:Excreted virulence factor EspC, type VII ESX diderm/EspA/EspE family